MTKLKIGYVPNSSDLSHPADRRRLVYWARKRGHEIVLDLNRTADVNVLSGRANLVASAKNQSRTPVIFDLVDAYLGGEKVWKDWARGTSKVLVGQISGRPRPYSEVVAEACESAQAVICETPEQRLTILPYCKNTHSILDFHEEFPMLNASDRRLFVGPTTLMWEGFPFTARGLLLLEKALSGLDKSLSPNLQVVTDLRYPLILGSYYFRDTEKILGDLPKILGDRLSISKWSIESVIETAKSSQIAVLPLDPAGSLNPLKAENRLLIMWRLGLPTLTSPSLAYSRVMAETGIAGICNSPEEWKTKLEEMIESSTIQSEMVHRGQQYIRDTHSEAKVLEAWDALFESVL